MTLQSCRFAGGLRGVLPEGEDAESESAMLGQEEALLVADRLHLVLRPFMLRRLKADVAADLPQKVLRMASNAVHPPVAMACRLLGTLASRVGTSVAERLQDGPHIYLLSNQHARQAC